MVIWEGNSDRGNVRERDRERVRKGRGAVVNHVVASLTGVKAARSERRCIKIHISRNGLKIELLILPNPLRIHGTFHLRAL